MLVVLCLLLGCLEAETYTAAFYQLCLRVQIQRKEPSSVEDSRWSEITQSRAHEAVEQWETHILACQLVWRP